MYVDEPTIEYFRQLIADSDTELEALKNIGDMLLTFCSLFQNVLIFFVLVLILAIVVFLCKYAYKFFNMFF